MHLSRIQYSQHKAQQPIARTPMSSTCEVIRQAETDHSPKCVACLLRYRILCCIELYRSLPKWNVVRCVWRRRQRERKRVHSRRRQCLCVLYACTLYRVKPKCSCMPTHTHTNTHTIAHSSPFTSVAIATDGVGLHAQAQVNGVDDDRVIPIAIFNAKASKLFFLPRDFSSKCFSFLSAILPSYK